MSTGQLSARPGARGQRVGTLNEMAGGVDGAGEQRRLAAGDGFGPVVAVAADEDIPDLAEVVEAAEDLMPPDLARSRGCVTFPGEELAWLVVLGELVGAGELLRAEDLDCLPEADDAGWVVGYESPPPHGGVVREHCVTNATCY